MSWGCLTREERGLLVWGCEGTSFSAVSSIAEKRLTDVLGPLKVRRREAGLNAEIHGVNH